MELRGSLDGPGVSNLLDLLLEPTPATHVRLVLKIHRDRGYGFEYAWAQAMRTLPRTLPERDWWRGHFHDTKWRWKEAFSAPAAQAELAATGDPDDPAPPQPLARSAPAPAA